MKTKTENISSIPDIQIDHTPIIKMLSSYISKETVSFHMPGHTNGKSFSSFLHDNAFAIDTTELDITDDLHCPSNAILDASLMAAKAFGSYRTYFVTTGSTSAIHASLMAISNPSDEIIIFRNVHKSVMNACVMFNLIPIFATEETLLNLLNEHPLAVGVLVTRPDYYGKCIDIINIAEQVHQSGRLLIVDEAHGTHFAFCPSLLPLPAILNGADLVVQSAHKTSPALTQASFLHISNSCIKNSRLAPEQIADSLSILTTSSPSFLIAATCDYARAFLEEYGDIESKKLFSHLEYFYSLLSKTWLKCFNIPDKENHSIDFDPFRIVITIKNLPFTSEELVTELSSNGIIVEFKDLSRVIIICKFGNSREDFIMLAEVLNKFLDNKLTEFNKNAECNEFIQKTGFENFILCKNRDDIDIDIDIDNNSNIKNHNHHITCPYSCKNKEIITAIKTREILDSKFQKIINEIPERAYIPCCGITKKHLSKQIPLKSAVGKIMFSAIIPYPPGIPLLWPGEIINEDHILLIEDLVNFGISLYGIENLFSENSNANIPHIRCICENEGFCRNK